MSDNALSIEAPSIPADAFEPGTAQGLIFCTLLFVVAGMTLMFLPIVFMDGDTWWHLAAGRYMFEHHAVPITDPFSYTFRGQPWVAHEWFSEVLMYASFAALSWKGLTLLFGLTFASTVTLIGHYAQRWMTPTTAACLALLVGYCLLQRIVARPHVLAWLVLAIWMIVLLRARERSEAPSLGWALLMVVWANLHGSYPMGLVLAGAFGLEALLEAPREQRPAVIRSWGLFGVAILVAAMVTPSGPEGLYFPFMVSTMESLSDVYEWQATRFGTFSFFGMALYAMLFFCLYRPVRVPPVRALLIVLVLHMALSHVRHHEIFAIVTGLILAEPLARAYRPGAVLPGASMAAQVAANWRAYAPLLAVAAAMVGLLIAARMAFPLSRENTTSSPIKALANLPPELRRQRVFNGYGTGGHLIWEGIPVFIDGRVDMYGDRFAKDFFDIEVRGNTEKWREADRRWHFCWTIQNPERQITHWLDEQPDWKRIYGDEWAVIHVRRDDPRCGTGA